MEEVSEKKLISYIVETSAVKQSNKSECSHKVSCFVSWVLEMLSNVSVEMAERNNRCLRFLPFMSY